MLKVKNYIIVIIFRHTYIHTYYIHTYICNPMYKTNIRLHKDKKIHVSTKSKPKDHKLFIP